MTRSVWKGPFVDGYLLKKAETASGSGRRDVIKIWASRIPAPIRGLNLRVYRRPQARARERLRGNDRPQKFGEFAPTRTYYGHAADKSQAAVIGHG